MNPSATDYFYIVELDDVSWIADWGGDPGRSCDRGYAQRFSEYSEAEGALARMRKVAGGGFPAAKISAVPASEVWDLFAWFEDLSTEARPCIGNLQARREAQRLQQATGVCGITVERNGKELTRWSPSSGWAKQPPPRKVVGGDS